MRPLRKIISVLLILVIIPVICGQIAAQTASALLLDPHVPETLAREAGLSRELERAVMLQVAGSLTGGATPFNLTRAEAEGLMHQIMPPARFELHTVLIVGGLQRWLAGETLRPEIILNLRAEREALPGALLRLAEVKVAALPVCTAQEGLRYAASPRTEMPPCRLSDPDANRKMIENVIASARVERFIPAELDLAEQVGPAAWDEQIGGLQAAQSALALIPFGWFAIGFLLLLLGLFNLDRWYTPFAWIGAALIAGGGLMLIGALGALNLLLPLLVTAASTTQFVVTALLESVGLALRNLSLTVMATGLGSLVIAVAGSLISSPPARDTAA